MLEIIALGLFAACAAMFLVFKLGNIHKVLAFDVPIDIAITTFLAMLFFGSFSGMAVAVVAGTIVSITLFILKKTIGYDKFTWKGWQKGPRPSEKWNPMQQ